MLPSIGQALLTRTALSQSTYVTDGTNEELLTASIHLKFVNARRGAARFVQLWDENSRTAAASRGPVVSHA